MLIKCEVKLGRSPKSRSLIVREQMVIGSVSAPDASPVVGRSGGACGKCSVELNFSESVGSGSAGISFMQSIMHPVSKIYSVEVEDDGRCLSG